MAAGEVREELLRNVRGAISDTVGPPTGGKRGAAVGVAFSGGVDSALVSGVCSGMGYDVTLLTMGFAQSHDVLFARRVNREYLGRPHHVAEIDPGSFADVALHVRGKIGDRGISWHENCIGFYYLSRLAGSLGIGTVVTANGIDELFCGYDVYRREFGVGAPGLLRIMEAKLDNEYGMMGAVGLVASEFNVRIVQPLLCPGFVMHAATIPLSEKIRGPRDLYRKHVIREIARDIGVPELSYAKRKKALQYGSGIHRMLLRTGLAGAGRRGPAPGGARAAR